MGLDDRDEGGDGCLEHVWQMTGVTLARDGSHVEHVCSRCGLPMVETPQDLRGER